MIAEPVVIDELQLISDHFSRALVWAANAQTLVEMGWRMHALISVMRPQILEGMALQVATDLERSLRKVMAGRDPLETGEHFRKSLAWLRRCGSLSQLGQRGFAMIYVLRRDLLSLGLGNTNAAIGSLTNKTRQAINKLVQNYRDTHFGHRNGVMRDEGTRKKCKDAHLNCN